MIILDESQLDSMIEQLGFKIEESFKVKDPDLKRFFMYVRFLSIYSHEIESRFGLCALIDIFYSQYYWFSQYKSIYFDKFGHDEGLEQQSFKMLEDYSNGFQGSVDWKFIEQIEKMVQIDRKIEQYDPRGGSKKVNE